MLRAPAPRDCNGCMLYHRRVLVKSGLAAGAWQVIAPIMPAQTDGQDPGNIKIAHRVDAKSITDDDLLFLQQIGLRWARLEFGEGAVTLDSLRAAQQRFAKFGIEIYSGVHYSYRSTRLQLGLPGRDEDIETYCRFLRDLGKLG